MALNFPTNPINDELYTLGTTTWQWDGTTWNIVEADSGRNIFVSFATDSGTASPDTLEDVLTIQGGTNVTTSITNKILTIDSTGTTQNLFDTILSDDGSTTANSATNTLSILGGINLSTEIATDTNNVTIDMDAFSIDFLSDVDTTSTPPNTGQVLKWNGTNWAPGADATTGGGGTDADTLDGFDSAYFLDYSNFSNTPSTLTLASLSVGVELTAAGDGAISYDDTSGEFRYTPPDLSTYLTSVPAQTFASLTSTPTTLVGYGITDAQETLVSATNIKTINGTSLLGSGNIAIAGSGGGIDLTDLSVGAEGTASGNGAISYSDSTGVFTYTPPVIPAAITDLGITDGSNGDVLTTNGSGTFSFTTSSSSTFNSLSDVTTASINVGKIYEPAIAMLRVDNVGTTAYTFPSHYSGNNPTIYAISGTTIAFDLDGISGHPFEIRDNTQSALTSDLVHVSSTGTVSLNSAAQGKSSGTLYFRIPENSNAVFVYVCQSHASMFGTISVKRMSLL